MAGLVSKSVARERILGFGGSKVGKSEAFLSIAKKCPDAHLYVIDTDFAIERMLEDGAVSNITYRTGVTEWAEYVEAVREFSKQMGRDDWLVIDFMSDAWDAVQTFYIDKRFGKSAEDYFLAHALANKKGNPLDGDKDWSVINKLYFAWVTEVLKAPGHVYATATARATGDRDSAEQKSTFGMLGSRPEGQKKLAHDFHTLAYFSKDRAGKHLLTTVGDRKRRLLDRVPCADFATTYLMAVAGWRPAT